MNGKTKSTNISYKWPYIVMEWERRENRISSRKWVVVQKCQILSCPHFRQCCLSMRCSFQRPLGTIRDTWTAGLNTALCWCLLLYYRQNGIFIGHAAIFSANITYYPNTPFPIATRHTLQWLKAELLSWESCHTSITTRHTVIKIKLFSWESCLCAKSCKQFITLFFVDYNTRAG